jgi:FKBP-type peptidyl-prolyl cis-trans isomerase SlyD
MQIAQDSVVNIQYTLRNSSGEVLDSSSDREPLVYIHGNGNLVPGVEKALQGRKAGDKLSFEVAPADGYGVRDDSLVQDVPRSAFEGVTELRAGMQFQADSNHGPRTVLVTQVGPETVTVDGNHPLAGQTLHFDVEVTQVRAATEEELEHGHVHGEGGHHH